MIRGYAQKPRSERLAISNGHQGTSNTCVFLSCSIAGAFPVISSHGAASAFSGNSTLFTGPNVFVLSVSVLGPVSLTPAWPLRLCESQMNVPSTTAAAGSPRPKPAPSATGSAFGGSGGADAVGVEALDGGEEVKKDVAVVMEVTGDDGMIAIVAGKEEVSAVADSMTPFPAAQQVVFETPQHQLPSTHFNISIEEDLIPAAKDRRKICQPSSRAEVGSAS